MRNLLVRLFDNLFSFQIQLEFHEQKNLRKKSFGKLCCSNFEVKAGVSRRDFFRKKIYMPFKGGPFFIHFKNVPVALVGERGQIFIIWGQMF